MEAAAARRIEAMSERTSALLAASYAVPDLAVAVQEAVYNAIDARASHVVVVVDAALASFTVEDDGDGIHPDEMFEHIFEGNVSSKRDTSAKKYGSRGQYLAALGTLAKQVELDSRVENHWTSFRKVVQDGKIVFNARSKTNKTTKGTVLRVQNVFQWLPVRKTELEARVSARTRLAKRLSAFFQSISMIWPMLSIDVSFPDAKVPRSVIPGVSSCDERLRGVFGDILGSELEYASFDDGDLPFTIRGYVGVVRDAGDGDAYLESPGWRQARAYYQYVFLDNFWLEEFQRECCKTINNAAIRLELGIPIFVVKISAKSLEYELHSDGETRVVNLKRPEVLTQSLCKFVEALKARVIEADASVEALSSSLDEEEQATEHVRYEDKCAVENAADALHVSTAYDEENFRYNDGMSRRSNQDGVDADDEREALQKYHDGESYFFEIADQFQDGRGDCYTRHESIDLRMYDRERTDGWATHTTMISEERLFATEYGEPATIMMFDDEAFEDDVSTIDPFGQYHGCAHCGSCGRSGVSRSSTQHQQLMAYEPVIHSDASGVVYEDFPPQPCEYDEYGYEYGFEYLLPAESTAAWRQEMYNEHREEYAEYEPEAALQSIQSGFECHEHEVAHKHTVLHQDPRAQTAAQVKQQRELDQLFFGQSIARSRESHRRREEVGRREKATTTDTKQWVSSRRVGVVDVADHSLEATESKAVSPSQNHQIRSMVAKSGQQLEMDTCDQDNKDRYLGSDQLSEYFSLEKLTKAHPRSLGSAIARFASKRTALAGSENAPRGGDRPRGVHVRKLPSDLHAPDAKIISLDKAMLQDLQVIKQVDRKFILVKATLGSTIAEPDAEGDTELSRSTRTLLLCIDQHAADERVRLEQLELQVFGTNGDERNVQVVDHEPALAVSLNDRERDTLNLFADEIQSWGFRVASSDTRVVHLTQTPRVDTRAANAEDFREYLQLLARSDAIVARRVVRPPAITRFLHSRACRSAITFGDYLSFSQCEDIVEQLRHCKLPFQCAHGRPSIVPLVELM